MSREQFWDLFIASFVLTPTPRLTSRFPFRISLRLTPKPPARSAAVSTLDLSPRSTPRSKPTPLPRLTHVPTPLIIDKFETKDHYKPK